MIEPNERVETQGPSATTTPSWRKPAAEVICLACEISAYAPDDGGPLF